MKTFPIILIIYFISVQSYAQRYYPDQSPQKSRITKEVAAINHIPKKQGHNTAEQWQELIDTTWGEGLPTAEKLALFDAAWNKMNAQYPCFQNLQVDWQRLYDEYRPEVAADVSQGRFAAIMNIMGMALQEGHTFIDNINVNWNTPVEAGVPLFNLIAHKNNSHFGACLTSLPDSSIFVYKAVPDHPLGLQPGDIIVGYDGISWKRLYKELLQAQLPYHFEGLGGSTERWWTQLFLGSAGLNWHLYDTLDVIKYGSSDTVHFPTTLLAGQTETIWDSDQLPVPGVPFWFDGSLKETEDPVGYPKNYFSWGYVENTNIAYIYIAVLYPPWQADIVSRFYNAVDSIMKNNASSGLILDIRLNYGGRLDASNSALSLFFNSDVYTVAFDRRCGDANDHFQMCAHPSLTSDYMKIPGDPATFFDRPIAVLTGPGCVSSGDHLALRMKLHSMARLFGRPTNGAFVGTWDGDNWEGYLSGNTNWYFRLPESNSYRVGEPGNYLTHIGFEPDEEVWLTADDVAKGEDTVVKRAMEWISNLAYAHDVSVDKKYAQPGADSVLISARVENPNFYNLAVMAYIKNLNNNQSDTLTLRDNINNGFVADNIRGNYYYPEDEAIFTVSVTTNDLTAETSRTLPDVAWFTSAGPVEIDSISSVRRSAFNPERLSFDIYLKNTGKTHTVKDVRATIYPDTSHPCFGIAGFSNYKTFGDIAAGESKAGTGFSIFMEEACHGDTIFTIPFSLEISSEGHVFWSEESGVVTSIEETADNKPLSYELKQNYPNPFNAISNFEFRISNFGHVNLSVYNILGQLVATLVDKKQAAGIYKVQWDAIGFSSGVYLYKLQAGDYSEVKKMLMLH